MAAVKAGPARLRDPIYVIFSKRWAKDDLDRLWGSSEVAVRACVRSALKIARERGYGSIGLPLMGAGTGGYPTEKVVQMMQE